MKTEPCDQCGRSVPAEHLKPQITNKVLQQIHMLCPECLAKQTKPDRRKRQ